MGWQPTIQGGIRPPFLALPSVTHQWAGDWGQGLQVLAVVLAATVGRRVKGGWWRPGLPNMSPREFPATPHPWRPEFLPGQKKQTDTHGE